MKPKKVERKYIGRNPKRIIEVLQTIDEVWKEHPNLRLGQIISLAVGRRRKVFYIEDDILLMELKKTKVRLEGKDFGAYKYETE